MNAISSQLTEALRLIYIVDQEAARDWRRLDAAFEAGTTCVWLRAPELSGAALYRTARELVWRAGERGAASGRRPCARSGRGSRAGSG